MKLAALLALVLVLGPDLRAEEGCTALPSGIALCGGGAGIEAGMVEAGTLETVIGPYGLRIEVAPLSATATTDPWFVRRELDAFLAASRGLEGDLPVLARDRIALADRAAELAVYTIGSGDAAVTVADSVILGDDIAIYVLTYDAGATFTEAHARAHDAALAALRLPAPRDPGAWAMPANRPAPRPLTPLPPES